jgi:U2-associated protein SR140
MAETDPMVACRDRAREKSTSRGRDDHYDRSRVREDRRK